MLDGQVNYLKGLDFKLSLFTVDRIYSSWISGVDHTNTIKLNGWLRKPICDIVFYVRTFWVLCFGPCDSCILSFMFFCVWTLLFKFSQTKIYKTVQSVYRYLENNMGDSNYNTLFLISALTIIYSPVPRPLPPLYRHTDRPKPVCPLNFEGT